MYNDDPNDNSQKMKQDIEEDLNADNEKIDDTNHNITKENDTNNHITENLDKDSNNKESSTENKNHIKKIKEMESVISQKDLINENLTKRLKIVSTHVRQMDEENKKKIDALMVRKNEEIIKKEKSAISKFALDLVNAIENFSSFVLPINADDYKSDNAIYNLITGSKMTLDLINRLLEKYDIEVIKPEINSLFDPNIHKAVTSQNDDKIPNNSIIALLQLGYKINDRVLRPASVVVSKNE